MQPELIPIILPLAFFAVYALAGGVLLGERKRGVSPRLIAVRVFALYFSGARKKGTVPFLWQPRFAWCPATKIGTVPVSAALERPAAWTILSSADRGGRVFVSRRH